MHYCLPFFGGHSSGIFKTFFKFKQVINDDVIKSPYRPFHHALSFSTQYISFWLWHEVAIQPSSHPVISIFCTFSYVISLQSSLCSRFLNLLSLCQQSKWKDGRLKHLQISMFDLVFDRLQLRILSKVNWNKKSTCTRISVYGVKEFARLSVVNFDPNYGRK